MHQKRHPKCISIKVHIHTCTYCTLQAWFIVAGLLIALSPYDAPVTPPHKLYSLSTALCALAPFLDFSWSTGHVSVTELVLSG